MPVPRLGLAADFLVIEAVGKERLLAGEGQRFRDTTHGMDGYMYAGTDGERCTGSEVGGGCALLKGLAHGSGSGPRGRVRL